MPTRIFTVAFLAATLLATSAQAAGFLASPPLNFSLSQSYQCYIVNAGTKNLGEVTTSVTKSLTPAPEVSSSSCTSMDANDSCGVISSAPSAGLRFCTVHLKGSAKAIRGRFCNTTTGECVDLR